MAPSVARLGEAVQWTVGCAREEYDAEVALRLEEGFQAFLGGNQEPMVRCCEQDVQRTVDFRVMEERSDMAGGGTVVRPVFRRVCNAVSPGAVGQSGAAVGVEWAHGQDVVAGVGFASYAESTAAILEENYGKFKDGIGLKGILFTASTGADYMVDFESMQQLRVTTRRARPIYRHAMGQDWRGGTAPASMPPAASARKAVHSEDPILLPQQQKFQHAKPQDPGDTVQIELRKEPSCSNVALLWSLMISEIRSGRWQRS